MFRFKQKIQISDENLSFYKSLKNILENRQIFTKFIIRLISQMQMIVIT